MYSIHCIHSLWASNTRSLGFLQLPPMSRVSSRGQCVWNYPLCFSVLPCFSLSGPCVCAVNCSVLLREFLSDLSEKLSLQKISCILPFRDIWKKMDCKIFPGWHFDIGRLAGTYVVFRECLDPQNVLSDPTFKKYFLSFRDKFHVFILCAKFQLKSTRKCLGPCFGLCINFKTKTLPKFRCSG